MATAASAELDRLILDSPLQAGPDVVDALAVKNRTFGGTIGSAGLLTVQDYLAAHEAWAASRRAGTGKVSQMIVPVESFDRRGFDLKRRHFSELERSTRAKVTLV